MMFLLADISEQWITTIGVLLAATLILVTLAGLMMKHLLARSLEKLDNSVQRAELGDVVRKSEMQLEILKLEKAIRDEIQTTRHDLRNESSAILGRMQEKLETLNHTLTNLQTGFARVEEAIKAKDLLKSVTVILCLFVLGACAAREPRPPRVGITPISENFNQVEASADKLDALANTMEDRGQ